MCESSTIFSYSVHVAPRWRLLPWLANPGNRAMSPLGEEETGTRRTELQWKEKGKGGGNLQICSNPKQCKHYCSKSRGTLNPRRG